MFNYQHRLLYVFIFVFSLFSVFDITEADAFKMGLLFKISFTVFIASLKTLIIMYLMQLLFMNKFLKAVGYTIITVFGILSIINLVSYQLYGFGITRKFILIVAQTTPRELAGFLPQLFLNIIELGNSLWMLIASITFLTVLIFIHYIPIKAFSSVSIISAVAGVVIYSIFAIDYTSGRTAVSLTARLAKYGREIYIGDKEFKALLLNRKELPYEDSIESTHLAKTVIVIIGESASRSHLSCYGYGLPTTPYLDASLDSLFLYSNAIGSSTSTSGNIERILSFKTDDRTFNDGLKYPLLIDVFEKADYKTYWLSNQERTGTVSNTSGVMSYGASVIKYLGAENSEDALAVKYDEILLPELTKALKDSTENKLIFLHMLGSHTQYSSRYPKSFDKFTAEDELKHARPRLSHQHAETIAEYDNSIRYTDYILGRILSMVDKEPSPALMIYFSDHGENVYDEDDYCGRAERFVEVPFIIYPNQLFREQNPEIIKLIDESVDKKFSTANFVHQLLTLTGTGYHFYDKSRDVMSEEFIERKRLVDEKEWKYE